MSNMLKVVGLSAFVLLASAGTVLAAQPDCTTASPPIMPMPAYAKVTLEYQKPGSAPPTRFVICTRINEDHPWEQAYISDDLAAQDGYTRLFVVRPNNIPYQLKLAGIASDGAAFGDYDVARPNDTTHEIKFFAAKGDATAATMVKISVMPTR